MSKIKLYTYNVIVTPLVIVRLALYALTALGEVSGKILDKLPAWRRYL